MKPILVIADDFTGAAEIGGIAVAFGLGALVAFEKVPRGQSHVLVVDSNTRHHRGDDAAARLKQLLGSIDPAQFDLIYKKTDSVLRGPVAAEITTIMKSLALERALLIPQNPSRSRVIQDGQYFIHGVPLDKTSFATDPEHPARTADVIALLDPQRQFGIRLIAIGGNVEESGINIGDGNSTADLDRWASQLSNRILPCGGADFFQAILRTRGLTCGESHFIPPQSSTAMFVCGSASNESRRFTATLNRTHPMPAKLFDPATADDAALEEWRRSICEELDKTGRVFVTVGQEPMSDRAAHVRRVLAEITVQVLRSHPSSTLFVEGGATAAHVITQMGWNELTVKGEISAGVIALTPEGYPRHLLIVKPGSYAWPDSCFCSPPAK
jgi:uncharacterized protein YgbK (DUF1537 family)